ncbi:MAG: hypothetical protein CGW95_10205 [Phenylobacterium zucineum]|nr:MAG: hypothetical protein CGW95_10205 [Phenylobacterium zucineum]
MTEKRVRLSLGAATDIIMSGLTAYERRHTKKEGSYVETGGELWGYVRRLPSGERLYYVEQATVSVFARRDHESIAHSPDETAIKRKVMQRLRPELTLLGDFHTHPYDDLPDVKSAAGWGYSPGDVEYWKGDDQVWEDTGNRPLFLILALCPLKRQIREAQQENFYVNILRFEIGHFRLWLHGVAGHVTNGQRRLSTTTHSTVHMDPLPLNLRNQPGSRLEERPPVSPKA